MRHLLLVLALLLPAAVHAADRTTPQSIDLPGGAYSFTASVQTIHLATPAGQPAAEIVTTAFLGPPSPTRPVTFAFNGGPGASSAWLNLGAIGPWRVAVARPLSPSQSPALTPNNDTWLPFTDLVFIDPPGTGYSRGLGANDPNRPFLSVDGDIQVLATTIRRWLEANNRLGSPKYLAGESYGGFRAPRLARTLLESEGIGIRGLVLISPVLDFNGRDAPYDPLRWATRIPSLAAAHRGATARTAVADAESYAAGPFVTDLLRGPNDAEAQSRLATTLSALTGLDEALIRRHAAQLPLTTVLRTATPGTVHSPYDGTVSTPDPFPAAEYDNSPDPILDGLRAPFTEAALTLYRTQLDWQPEGAPNRQYELLNTGLNRQWDYGRGNTRPEAMTALRQYLALDGATGVLVTHGITDLVTPYFATALLLRQVPQPTPPGRLRLLVLPGGHMSYLNDDSRHALHDAAQALVTTPP